MFDVSTSPTRPTWTSCLVTADHFPGLALEPSTPLVIGTMWDDEPYEFDHPGKELLLIAPSALIPISDIKPGDTDARFGVFALANLPRKQDVGLYGGKAIAWRPTRKHAVAEAKRINGQSQHMLVVQGAGNGRRGKGWTVVEGSAKHHLPPLLHKLNTARGTRFANNCKFKETGRVTVVKAVPRLDLTRPLKEQARSELAVSYGPDFRL